ncbi:hypothetical protein [Litoribacillus peritrichatus]|uniref:Uncharacterized protein n=1 Tax=Litoribacillus peritrichatus TaxID=718191 RepID=A0ABP7MCB9_9GAMM
MKTIPFDLADLQSARSGNVPEGKKLTDEEIKKLQLTSSESQTVEHNVALPPSITVDIASTPIINEPNNFKAIEGLVRYSPQGDAEFLNRNEYLASELDTQTTNRQFLPSLFLSYITELDLSEGSYFDGSRSYAGFAQMDEAGKTASPSYQSLRSGANVEASFSLEIETKDGDKVTININKENGIAAVKDSGFLSVNGTSFSFEFEGELDEEELEAIQNLAVDFSDSAGAFFNGRGMAELNGLQGFDRDELVGFDLELKNSHTSSKAEFHFEIDQFNGNQTLEATQNGLTYDFTVDTNNELVSGSLEENAQFQSYLDIIDKTAKSYKMFGVSPDDVASFFTDGFSSALNIGLRNEDDEKDTSTTLNPNQTSVAKSVLSGLPDFEANFFGTRDIAPNPQNPQEKSFMSLEIDQETKIREGLTRDGKYTEVEQTSTYDMDIRQHKPLNGLNQVDFKNGNYKYETLKEEGSLIRSINMDGQGAINSAIVNQSQSKEETTKEYENGKLTNKEAIKEQITDTLITSDLGTLQQDKLDRQLGLYKVIDELLDE